MNEITAQVGQTIVDIVLMAMGTLQGAYDFCQLNGVALSDVPVIGTVYKIPTLTPDNSNSKVLAYITDNNLNIGTLERNIAVPVITFHTFPFICATTGLPFDATFWIGSYAGILNFYDVAIGGSPIIMPTSFSEEGIITRHFWVSNTVDGVESMRIPFDVNIYSVPILTYTGAITAVGHLDLSLGVNFPNEANCGIGYPGTPVYFDLTTSTFVGPVITASGDYMIAVSNFIGETTDTAPIYITIT